MKNKYNENKYNNAVGCIMNPIKAKLYKTSAYNLKDAVGTLSFYLRNKKKTPVVEKFLLERRTNLFELNLKSIADISNDLITNIKYDFNNIYNLLIYENIHLENKGKNELISARINPKDMKIIKEAGLSLKDAVDFLMYLKMPEKELKELRESVLKEIYSSQILKLKLDEIDYETRCNKLNENSSKKSNPMEMYNKGSSDSNVIAGRTEYMKEKLIKILNINLKNAVNDLVYDRTRKKEKSRLGKSTLAEIYESKIHDLQLSEIADELSESLTIDNFENSPRKLNPFKMIKDLGSEFKKKKKKNNLKGVRIDNKTNRKLKNMNCTLNDAINHSIRKMIPENEMKGMIKCFINRVSISIKRKIVVGKRKIKDVDNKIGLINIGNVKCSLKVTDALKIVKSNYLLNNKNIHAKYSIEDFVSLNERLVNIKTKDCDISHTKFSELVIKYVNQKV